jgi:hypothetical protein
MCRRGRLVFAELKSAGRYPTPDQRDWLAALESVERIETYLWRPDDMEYIEERLR